ncbi:7275_t:CDS:2, partial [Entrophospora sp. SA101]
MYGAAVIIGNKKGVAMQLKQLCPFIVVNHCVAHRLALACKDARKEIIFYNQAEEMMKTWYDAVKNVCESLPALLILFKESESEVDEDYDDLLSNIYEYASMVIYEINVRFPDYPLVTAMKALNPSEWLSIESENFIKFGLSELKILVDIFGVKKSTNVNGYNEISPLIDQNECQNEYP